MSMGVHVCICVCVCGGGGGGCGVCVCACAGTYIYIYILWENTIFKGLFIEMYVDNFFKLFVQHSEFNSG